ncbi:hypothetical protein SDC9_159545 [bioreactor metagenome]|uniref:Uncharacterized protein n=1 Tax=bioreactor metagenome TaxID=1076179 RepID=A0A645FJ10_9ZZZZ
MRINHYRLCLSITYHPNAAVSRKILDIILEFVSEIAVLKAVYCPLKAFLFVEIGKACPFCSQMGMIICPIKYITDTIGLGYASKKAAH